MECCACDARHRGAVCRLRFDGRFIVDLEVTDDEDAIYLYARLGTLPAGEQGRELMARMHNAVEKRCNRSTRLRQSAVGRPGYQKVNKAK